MVQFILASVAGEVEKGKHPSVTNHQPHGFVPEDLEFRKNYEDAKKQWTYIASIINILRTPQCYADPAMLLRAAPARPGVISAWGAVACGGCRLIQPARMLCLEGLSVGLFDSLRDAAVAWRDFRLIGPLTKYPVANQSA